MQPLTPSMNPCWLLTSDGCVRAGFPSPAEDLPCEQLDLNQRLIRNPLSSYFMRVSGDSMIDAGIFDGSFVVVDRSVEPEHGHIVVAYVDNDLTIKYLHSKSGRIRLVAANQSFLPIIPKDGTTIQIFGVARAVFTPLPGFSI